MTLVDLKGYLDNHGTVWYFQEIDLQDEQIKNTSGKMDEINSILSVTQQKINTFKVPISMLIL